MVLNNFGLIFDFIGFSFLSLGAWEELKRRKTVEYGIPRIKKYQKIGESRDIFLKKEIEDLKNEIFNYKINRDEEQKYLKQKKIDDTEERDSFGFGMEDMQEFIDLIYDGKDFDLDAFEQETKKELKKMKDRLKELTEMSNIYLKDSESSKTIIENFISKYFDGNLAHLNRQEALLVVGGLLVWFG